MRFGVAAIVGVAILTFALYVQAARDLDRGFVLLMDVNQDDATHHRPLLVARAAASDTDAALLAYLFADKSTTAARDSLAQAISSGTAWSLSGSDVSIRIDLQHVETALTERLIATDDKTERERLLEVIRAIRRLRNDSRRAKNVVISPVANDNTPKPLTAATVQPPVASGQTAKSVASDTDEGATGVQSATEANAVAVTRNADTEKRRVFFTRALIATLYFFVIVVGIYAGVIYEALGRYDPTKNLKFRHLLRPTTTASAWQGLFASPVVFAVVLVLVPPDDVSVAMMFFAFQNGFFWRTTLQRLVEVRATRSTASEPAANAN